MSYTEHAESTEAWRMDPGEITLGPRLAVGGFAEVFRAKWQGTDVAVKKLLETDRRTVERLETEVRVLAKLRHPNVREPPPSRATHVSHPQRRSPVPRHSLSNTVSECLLGGKNSPSALKP